MAIVSTIKSVAKKLPPKQQENLRRLRDASERIVFGTLHRLGYTRYNILRNRSKARRQLEIGPGGSNIVGFETLDVVPRSNVDYLVDAATELPFAAETFDLIYASHILEHLPWYQTESVLRHWVQRLKPGGRLEVWVPNGLLICRAFVDAEDETQNVIHNDGWYKFNPERDPCTWANGRIFSYGGGDGTRGHPNWHLALFSPRKLLQLLRSAGLNDVVQLDRTAVRGYDHGWINLGAAGTKG